ncbi:lipoprotein [Spirochaetia bacterium]|nr:lipoprotein [Spirochaetia bacterium]
MCPGKISRTFGLCLIVTVTLLTSCSQRLGWGILLWSSEEPVIPSGTVLPVYIRSNIDKVWVVGIPKAFRTKGEGLNKFEVPLAQFEFSGSKRKARARAADFAQYALVYAENLQDGLPMREFADNSSRRMYRLKTGEIIKILAQVEGAPAISTTGDPLPGDWYRVMAGDGTMGYCFSYRLKLFEHTGGVLTVLPADQEAEEDPDLEQLLAKTWSAESYGTMLTSRRFNLEELSRHWRFFPGQDTGTARIFLPNLDQTFSHAGIRAAGEKVWRFEGTNLQMSLRSDTTLAVQFSMPGEVLQSLIFVALPAEVDDLIMQETARREDLFSNIYNQGPEYTSNNYGTLVFGEGGDFVWTDNQLLIPQVIPPAALESGSVAMDLYLSPEIQNLYEGAFSLHFNGARLSRSPIVVRFMYARDARGFRVEYVPDTSLDGNAVVRRASSPTVIYFYRAEHLGVN